MQEAVLLAADASGDGGLRHGARQLAKRMERGEVIRVREDLPPDFPPLLAWSVVSGAGQEGLSQTLEAEAYAYRRRALRSAHRAAVYLPILLTVVIGGSAVFLQALSVFWPFTQLLYELGFVYR